MDSSINKLSLSAAQLLEQKKVLPESDFNKQLEDIVFNLAKINSDDSIQIPEELGLLEKMSFEIRTPMNSILGFTGLLKDTYFTVEEKDEFIDLIEKNTEQLIELLNDLTELTKVDNLQINLKMEKFELNVFLLNLISEFNTRYEEKGLSLIKKSSSDIPKAACVYTDPYQLKRILSLLLKNLAKFENTEPLELYFDIIDGTVLHLKLTSTQLELPETISRSIKKHIDPDKNKMNFDGTGLKLTLTKALIDLLNGQIQFNSQKHKGSEFEIKIPIRSCSMD